MSFLAHLFINQRKIRVLRSHVHFSQNKDMTGKPQGRVNGGIIRVTIELTSNSDILHQMMNAEQMVDGSMRFYMRDGMSKLCDYEFFDTYIFYYRVHQTANGTNPAMIDIGFSCGILRIGSAILKKPWHVTNLEAMENPDIVETEPMNSPEPRIIRQYITNRSGQQLKEYGRGDKIYLIIESRYMVGEEIDINLSNKTVDFLYMGRRLENDFISGYIIDSDIEKIPLEVIPEDYEDL